MMRILYCVLLLLIWKNSFAQKAKPELVSDMCTLPRNCSSVPRLMNTYKDKLLFVTLDSTARYSIFHTYTRSEGITNPYLFNGDTSYSVYAYTILGDFVYFLGYISVNGVNIWTLIKWNEDSLPQIISTSTNAAINNNYIVALNNKIYYIRSKSTVAYYELWEYDPATASEKILFTKNENAYAIHSILGKLFIVSTIPGVYSTIYTYDPQNENITEVIRTAYVPSIWEGGYVEIDNYVYFFSGDAASTNLYKYDGINNPVKLMQTLAMPYGTNQYMAYGNNKKIYYTANTLEEMNDLWEYDVQQNKVRQVTFSDYTQRSRDQHPIFYNNKIIYDASYIGTPDWRGLHIYDITTDSNWSMPMPFDYSTNFISNNLYVYNKELYLSARTDSLGIELYRYSESTNDSFHSSLYPNPTSNTSHLNIEINTSQVFTLTILDMLGHTIMHKRLGVYPRGKHTIDIPLQHLAAGVYTCTLRGSKNILYKGKVVKL